MMVMALVALSAAMQARPISIAAKITALYVAYFDRAPDYDGLLWWLQQAKESGDPQHVLSEISRGFAMHPVFAQTYGGMSDREFVEAIYKNALGRPGDEAGIRYWTDRLAKGLSRPEMVKEFVSGALETDLTPENFPALSKEELEVAQERQDLISNKVMAAFYYVNDLLDKTDIHSTENVEEDPAYRASIKIVSEVDADSYTVASVAAYLAQIKKWPEPIEAINQTDKIVEYDHLMTIAGSVKDAKSKQPIMNAQIMIPFVMPWETEVQFYTHTDADGNYRMKINSDWLQVYDDTKMLVNASAEGYLTESETISISPGATLTEDFLLTPLSSHLVNIESSIIHLGDDGYTGTINSKFQRPTMGDRYQNTFVLDAQQASCGTGQLLFFAKGVQGGMKLYLNGHELPVADSPDSGDYAEQKIEVGGLLREGENRLVVDSITTPAYSDLDDFEFTNVRLRVCNQSSTHTKEITGKVIDATTGEPLSGVAIILPYVDASGKNREYRAETGSDGSYEIALSADEFSNYDSEARLLVTASKEGYESQSKQIRINDQDLFDLDFSLTRGNEMLVWIDSSLHHLGDDSYSGSANSKFQKNSEGVQFTTTFEVNAKQLQCRYATVAILAKGIQSDQGYPNKITLNDQSQSLYDSPENGDYEDQEYWFEISGLHEGTNRLTISSGQKGTDYDDFEFTNLRVYFCR